MEKRFREELSHWGEEGRERGREGGREGGRKEGKEREREGGREGGGREGGREGERGEGRVGENERMVRERKRVKVSCVTINICREFSKFFFTPLVEIFRGRIDGKETANVLLHREETPY